MPLHNPPQALTGSGNPAQFLNGQLNFSTPSGIANAYISQAFTAQTSVKVIHNFGARPCVDVIIDNSKAEGVNVLYTEDDLVTQAANQFIVLFSEPTSGEIIATLGSPQLSSYLATGNNYTGIASDYFVEFTAPDKTFTFPTAVGRSGKTLAVINSSTGQLNWNTTSNQTVSGSLIGQIQALSAILCFSNGTNWIIYSSYYNPTGWDDLIAESADDSTNPFSFVQVGTTGRYAYSASSNNALSKRIYTYHFPHDIVIAPDAGFLHPHFETGDNGAGNVELKLAIYIAPPNEAWSLVNNTTLILTPSVLLSAGKNRIVDTAIPPSVLAQIEPDAKMQVVLERDSRNSNPNDTYAGTFYLWGFDTHTKKTGKLTTSKDKQGGWVQV